MSDRATRLRWLTQLTALPTVAGREQPAVEWVEAWAARRREVTLRRDRAGNLLLGVRHRRRRRPLVAVAHLDHPGFAVIGAEGRRVRVEFRGGMHHSYFTGRPPVEVFDHNRHPHPGHLVDFDPATGFGMVELTRSAPVAPGDVGRWRFPTRALGVKDGRLRAHACDDLAGVAAALALLDEARDRPELGHVSVLLTRAEEVGLVGAIAACRYGTLPAEARVVSIECSRSYPESPLGGGPVVRVGDASTVFDADLTNAVADLARSSGLVHQRRLMAGGTCEASVFGTYGWAATGLCLPLANYHNQGDLERVEQGGQGSPAPEEVAVDDFEGLVELLVAVAAGLGDPTGLSRRERLDRLYEQEARVLSDRLGG